MPAKWFILKDDSAGADTITPLKAAMHTATAAKITGDVEQSVRTCAYDATLQMVKADITDAERVGSLAALARDQEGVGIFVMEMVDIDDHQRRAFNQLGEVHPECGVVVTDLYIRPDFAQASPGAAVTSVATGTTGRNFQDGLSWEDYRNLPGRPTTNVHTYVCDTVFGVVGAGYNDATNRNIVMAEGTSAASRNRYYYDYPGHRGTLICQPLMTEAMGVFTNVSGDVWSVTLSGVDPHGPSASPKTWFYRDLDAATGDYGVIMDYATSQAEMEATVDTVWMSSYVDGGTLFVHMPPGVNPNNRIIASHQNPVGNRMWVPPDGNAAFNEFIEERLRCIPRGSYPGGDNGGRFLDGARWLRGRNAENGSDRQGAMYCMYADRNALSKNITGPYIEGRKFRDALLAWFHDSLVGGPHTFSMSGTHFIDVDTKDIGGVIKTQDNSDGHSEAWQGSPGGPITYEGKLHLIDCGGPFNCYAGTANDPVPANLRDEGFDLTMDCPDTLIQGHAQFWSHVGGGNDVGIHLTGDTDITGDFENVSIKLSGLISGFRRGIRDKWSGDKIIEAHTQDSLVVERGAYSGGDDIAVFAQVGAVTHEVTLLPGDTGTWAIGDIIEDPANSGQAIGIVTRVIGSNPTVFQFRDVDEGVTPYISDAAAVVNLTGTGSGTADGAAVLKAANICGKPILKKIKFAGDWTEFVGSNGELPVEGNMADRNALGFHWQDEDCTYVGDTTGKFNTTAHGVQDLDAWKLNSASDNTYGIRANNPLS